MTKNTRFRNYYQGEHIKKWKNRINSINMRQTVAFNPCDIPFIYIPAIMHRSANTQESQRGFK